MQSRAWISTLLLTGLVALISTASRCEEAIGSTTSVKPQAEANTRTLSTGSSVYSKELIHTGDSGVANLRFHDNSNLSVGPNRASGSTSSFTTQINLLAALLLKRHAAPYDLLAARRAGRTRSRPLTARLAYAAERTHSLLTPAHRQLRSDNSRRPLMC
jgi:hypothetical protein